MDRFQDVSKSSRTSHAIASPASAPHISGSGLRLLHTFGRAGCPKIRQRFCASSCTHRSPARLPSGMPGMGDDIEGAMQQAPQPGRQVNSLMREVKKMT